MISSAATLGEIANAVGDVRFLHAEFMYAPRPTTPLQRRVFGYCLNARLSALDARDAVVWIADSPATVTSLMPIAALFPHLRFAAVVCNPALYGGRTGDTPVRSEWETPEQWRRYATTDRWARLLCALELGQLLDGAGGQGALLMPAWDAVYSAPLLDGLLQRSGGAAISPVTFYQHSAIPNTRCTPGIIHALNAAYYRDSRLMANGDTSSFQGLWGKMSLLPFQWCAPLRAQAEPQVWEDDRELSSVLAALGGVAAAWAVRDPHVYRLSPPLFTRADLKRALLRILHYSLDIPAPTAGGASFLTHAPDARIQAWIDRRPRWAAAYALADALVAECVAETAARLAQFGCSWVDWGRFRCVARVGDPFVEVWRR